MSQSPETNMEFPTLVHEMDKAVADLRRLIQTVSTEQVAAEGRLNLLNERVESLLQTVKASGDGLESRTRKIETTLAELRGVQSELQKLNKDVRDLERRGDDLSSAITTLKGSVAAIKAVGSETAQVDRDRVARNQLIIAAVGAAIALASMGVAIWAVLQTTGGG